MSNEFKYRELLYNDYFNSQSGRTFHLDIEKKLSTDSNILSREILPLIPSDKNSALLDMGCGFGSLIYTLKKKGYTNLKGIDLSEGQVKVAHELGLTEIELQDLLPYLKNNKNTFDVITGIDIIEHFSKDELVEVLTCVKDALKPNGTAIFRTPNLDAPFATLFSNGDFTHENYINYSSANQLMLSMGFKNIQVLNSIMETQGFLKELFRKLTWAVMKTFIKLLIFSTARTTNAMVFSPNLIIKVTKP
ncbi:MAG: methyltransferase domain-containing protein [Sphingobacteriales bacterium]|jgi:2-polyprenyl-3-methyl-5-hydroxy-6-metoxy-1,4-benzoquinol methylase|nr:methyltransferase domain-containing protein [Sphingobacteriales bacterium]